MTPEDVKRLEAEMPKPSRLTILVNPADVLPDRSLSEPVQSALKPFKDLIVGLPLIVSQGAPVGVPLLLNQGQAMESPHAAFLRYAEKKFDEAFLGHAKATTAFEWSLGKATESMRAISESVAALRHEARHGCPFDMEALDRDLASLPPQVDPPRRRARGLRRHIRRVKAEKRRKG